MVILDTNHMDALMIEHTRRDVLVRRLKSYPDGVATTIITVQENLEGWLHKVNDNRLKPIQWVPIYEKLEKILGFYAAWRVVRFDDAAAQEYTRLKALKMAGPRTNDLRIAAIALCHNATVLTSDLHFDRIQDRTSLHVENWLSDESPSEPSAP